MTVDLNLVVPEDREDGLHGGLKDQSIASGRTRVYFRDLAAHLIEHISEADAVVGCVAWLTHQGVIDALASKDVCIIVQKEDFLRPDFGDSKGLAWRKRLRKSYSGLSAGELRKFAFRGTILPVMSTGSEDWLDGVRCVGNHNRDKKPAFPRMHNKFLVFGKHHSVRGDDWGVFKPHAVWTGSFNVTTNATLSLENALYLTDPAIVRAYYREFGQIAALSEPLDWESDWCEPEWRIGT